MVGGGGGGRKDQEEGAEEKKQSRRFHSGRSQPMGYGLRANPKKSRRVSEEEEIEMEIHDLAMCLMLLSRDTSSSSSSSVTAAAALTNESSDKNSAVVEENGVEVPVWDVKKRRKSQLGTSQSSPSWIGRGGIGSKSKKCKRSDGGSDELGKSVMVISSTKKSSRFQCESCKRNFGSYQALGGHRAAHKRTKGCSPPPENSSETEIFSPPADVDNANANDVKELGIQITISFESPKKKEDRYKCPICFKVFGSGQALGGHKRAHLAANSSSEKQAEKVEEVLDLNAPAFTDDNSSITNGHGGSVAWSAGRRCKHDLLVSGR